MHVLWDYVTDLQATCLSEGFLFMKMRHLHLHLWYLNLRITWRHMLLEILQTTNLRCNHVTEHRWIVWGCGPCSLFQAFVSGTGTNCLVLICMPCALWDAWIFFNWTSSSYWYETTSELATVRLWYVEVRQQCWCWYSEAAAFLKYFHGLDCAILDELTKQYIFLFEILESAWPNFFKVYFWAKMVVQDNEASTSTMCDSWTT